MRTCQVQSAKKRKLSEGQIFISSACSSYIIIYLETKNPVLQSTTYYMYIKRGCIRDKTRTVTGYFLHVVMGNVCTLIVDTSDRH